MIQVLCIDHLHAFEVSPADQQPHCPECGCRSVRLAGRHASDDDVIDANVGERRLTVQAVEGRHKVGGDTWLSDKGKFVELAAKYAPGAAQTEIADWTRRWFGE